MQLLNKVLSLAVLSCVTLIGTSQSHAAFYSGWTNAGITLPSQGQPWNAQGYVANHGSTGKILYTGKTWSSSPPHVVRNEGEYINWSTANKLDSKPFKAMELYLYSGSSIYSGTTHKYVDFTLKMPGQSQTFNYNLQLTDYGNSLQLSILDSIADPIVDYKGNQYQLEMLGFSTNNGNTICDSFCTWDRRAKTADIMFQLKEYTAPIIPTPTTASITLGLLGFAALKRRR